MNKKIETLNSALENVRLCTSKPIGKCNRTREYVYPSIIEGYSAYCPELDEDLYSMEWTKIHHENR